MSNNCVAIHMRDLAAADIFYTTVLKFKLLKKTEAYLEYDTGHFLLYVNHDVTIRPPIPSFTVKDLRSAKQSLQQNGCEILREDSNSFYFKDPFGITYDVIQDGAESK